MLSGEIRLWTLAPGVRLFWERVVGHVAQKHQSNFPRSSSFDDFDQRPPRQQQTSEFVPALSIADNSRDAEAFLWKVTFLKTVDGPTLYFLTL